MKIGFCRIGPRSPYGEEGFMITFLFPNEKEPSKKYSSSMWRWKLLTKNGSPTKDWKEATHAIYSRGVAQDLVYKMYIIKDEHGITLSSKTAPQNR